jgi:phage/plasmid-like protein (TIGR03299 family)
MVSRQSAFHGIEDIHGELFSRDKIDAAGITFTAEKHQLEFQGDPIDAYGVFRVMPEGNLQFIAGCGENYEIHPASTIFDTMDEVLGEANGRYETAGILGNGNKVWGLADIGATLRVGNDEQKGYLAGATSFDGSMSSHFWLTLIRIVCQNTLNESLRAAKDKLSYRHTSKSYRKLLNAAEALAAVNTDLKSIEERLNFLASKSAGGIESAKTLLEAILEKPVAKSDTLKAVMENRRRENILSEILAIYDDNDGNAFPEQRGTVYNLLNAVTNYTDHQRSTRAKDEAERDQSRQTSAIFGSGDKLKAKAVMVLTQYAQSANSKPISQIVAGYTGGSVLDSIINQ